MLKGHSVCRACSQSCVAAEFACANPSRATVSQPVIFGVYATWPPPDGELDGAGCLLVKDGILLRHSRKIPL